ncbi:MAG: glycosyltransferase [Lachnospiraceae bacterium]|nr:glycosyltransferase [Lachnospiraceae bacterium]
MSEKLLTIAIPCYNSQDYMDKAVRSVLSGGDKVEILIVDDGSLDDTARIADRYEEEYPNIVRAIHQKNGGHGVAVNTGIREAKGMYFKVLDSDDWFEKNAYKKYLDTLEMLSKREELVDLLITNFVYEKPSENHRRRMLFRALFPTDKVIAWEDMKRNIKGFSILMHAVTYRTQLLRDIGLELPAHTFYVDNLFVYEPLPHVKKFYYLDEDLYRYYIGREGQSITEQTMIRRIDQQFAVNYRMIDAVDLYKDVKSPRLRAYMLGYLEMITVVSTSLSHVSKDPVNYEKAKKLWQYIKDKDKRVYYHIRFGIFGQAVAKPGALGRFISVKCYHLTQWFMRFN